MEEYLCVMSFAKGKTKTKIIAENLRAAWKIACGNADALGDRVLSISVEKL